MIYTYEVGYNITKCVKRNQNASIRVYICRLTPFFSAIEFLKTLQGREMKKQINSLTSTRAIAALFVFIFHFGRSVFPFNMIPGLFSGANIAVSYFYVLSGFVMYIAHLGERVSFGRFLKKRLVRILPAYILALFLFVLVCLYIYQIPYSSEFLLQIVLCSLLVQAYFPLYALVLNTAAWSISVEMMFYLLFPALSRFQQKNNRLFLVFTILIFFATQVVFSLFFKAQGTLTVNYNFFLYNPLMHINQFLVGMAGGFLFKKVPLPGARWFPITLVLFVLALFIVALRPVNAYYDTGFLAPLFLLIILFAANTNPPFLNLRPIVYLGEISYGIYILQFPVHEITGYLSKQFFHFTEAAFFYVSMGALVLTASASYHFLELPARRLANPKRKQ